MPSNKPLWLYGCAALIGLIAALYNALGVGSDDGQIAAARVNGQIIPEAEYARALSAMQDGLKRSLTDDDKARALDLLVDEELIVQRAIDLGLAGSDRLVRKNLVQAMMRSTASLAEKDPGDEALHDFYQQNIGLYTAPIFVTVSACEIGAPAKNFETAIQGGTAFSAACTGNDGALVTIPPRLPLLKSADYIGGPARDQIAKMQAGDIAGPVPLPSGEAYIWLQEKTGGGGNFSAAIDKVRADWLRRAEEEAFTAYVKDLRRAARIQK